MPTLVKATKYRDRHWARRETEYRVTTYTPREDDFDGECDHHGRQSSAEQAARSHHAETGNPAIVERVVHFDISYDGVEWDRDPEKEMKETVVWKSPDFPVDVLGFDD